MNVSLSTCDWTGIMSLYSMSTAQCHAPCDKGSSPQWTRLSTGRSSLLRVAGDVLLSTTVRQSFCLSCPSSRNAAEMLWRNGCPSLKHCIAITPHNPVCFKIEVGQEKAQKKKIRSSLVNTTSCSIYVPVNNHTWTSQASENKLDSFGLCDISLKLGKKTNEHVSLHIISISL